MILGVLLGYPKSGFFVVFWGLDQKVPQGGLKDLFLHPRTSKPSFSDTLQGQLSFKNVIEMQYKL